MKQRSLGTGPTVWEIGLGCMSLTGAYGWRVNVPWRKRRVVGGLSIVNWANASAMCRGSRS
jgi:aryl-alcohol dehydrogenase-like predicted oxidoreductase